MKKPLMRAGMRFKMSSSRAAVNPKDLYIFRTMADHTVHGIDRLINQQTGKPNRTYQKTGAITPSEKFSAKDSIAARLTPCSSN